MRPDGKKLETMVRAEADSKLAAIGPLELSYDTLVRAREEFARRDADNVAAVQQARSEAIRAGLTVRTLDQLGFTAVEPLVRETHSRIRPRQRPKSELMEDQRKATTGHLPDD